MGHRGARQRKAGDTEAPGSALVTTSGDAEVQSGGHGELGITGRGTARHRNLGQGIQRPPEAWGGGHWRHPGEQGRGQRQTGKGGTGATKELRRGEKGHSGDRENTVRVRRSAEEPCLAGKRLPSRAAPGRGSRSPGSGVRSGRPGARRQPCSLPRDTGSEPRRKASSSSERLRARTGRGRAPVLPGERRRPGAGDGSSAETAAPVAASSGGAGGPGGRWRVGRDSERAPRPNENLGAAGSLRLG